MFLLFKLAHSLLDRLVIPINLQLFEPKRLTMIINTTSYLNSSYTLKSFSFLLLCVTSTFGCVNPVDHDTVHSEEKGYYLQDALWKTLDIPVCWESLSQSNRKDRLMVMDSINQTWGSAAPFNFYGWDKCRQTSAGIRIRVADEGPHV